MKTTAGLTATPTAATRPTAGPDSRDPIQVRRPDEQGGAEWAYQVRPAHTRDQRRRCHQNGQSGRVGRDERRRRNVRSIAERRERPLGLGPGHLADVGERHSQAAGQPQPCLADISRRVGRGGDGWKGSGCPPPAHTAPHRAQSRERRAAQGVQHVRPHANARHRAGGVIPARAAEQGARGATRREPTVELRPGKPGSRP